MDQESRFFGGRRGYHHGRLKDALVEAARMLAAERGPAGFTLAEAAKRVGVTAAAPYRHFTDRNALMGELARRGFEQFADELAAAWADGAPDPVSAFRRMGEAYLAFARREPGLYAAMFGNVATLDTPESGAAADRALAALRRAAQAVLAHHGASGDARDLAFEIWSLSHGVAMLTVSGHLDPTRAGCDPSAILQAATASIVEGAIRRSRAAPPPAPPSGPWGRRG